MERCPACRARVNGLTQCSRCGSDLSLALQAEAEAKQWTERAARHFSEGAFDDADAALNRAIMLHQTPLALSLRAFFRQRGTLRPASTAKPDSMLLKRVDHAQSELNEIHPVSPVVGIGQRLGRGLLRALTRADMPEGIPERKLLPSEPDGLIVWLEDACRKRPAAGKLALKAETIVKSVGDAVTDRQAAEQAERPETAPSDSVKTFKEAIRAASIEVYRTVGPGLPASVYEECLCREFNRAGVAFKRQVPIAVDYKDVQLDSGYRMNLFLADKIVVLIEGADTVHAVQSAPILDFLCAGGWTAGLVINFNVAGSIGARLEDS